MSISELGLVLRAARPDDAEFFYETRRAGFREYAEASFGPWSEDKQREAAAKDFAELPLVIVERAAVRIGYLVVIREPDHLFLDEIALIPEARNRGIGTALVELTRERARDAGLELRLSVLATNRRAQDLYERMGFRVTHVEPPRVKMTWSPHLPPS